MSLQSLRSSTAHTLDLPQQLSPPRSPASTQQTPSLAGYTPEPSYNPSLQAMMPATRNAAANTTGPSFDAPGSATGCTIFVKLWQFAADDRRRRVIDTGMQAPIAVPDRPGVMRLPLLDDADEAACIEDWRADTDVALAAPGGLELLVLGGGFREGGEDFTSLGWLRLPAGAAPSARSGPRGCRAWIKRGHLASPPRPPVVAG